MACICINRFDFETEISISIPLHFIYSEESTVLEEKRKQLEAEEARLQKESEELVNQKKQLEEQKNLYEVNGLILLSCIYDFWWKIFHFYLTIDNFRFFNQQLQAEKEEAWKAEQLSKSAAIHSAQKELEEVMKWLYLILLYEMTVVL